MKKNIILLLVLLLTGCSGKNIRAQPAENPVPAAPTAEYHGGSSANIKVAATVHI